MRTRGQWLVPAEQAEIARNKSSAFKGGTQRGSVRLFNRESLRGRQNESVVETAAKKLNGPQTVWDHAAFASGGRAVATGSNR
jgi:hypothetical protein